MTWPALVAWVLDESLISWLVVVHVHAAVDRRRSG